MEKSVAYEHLLEAVLKRHHLFRETSNNPDSGYVDFSDEEISQLVETLWNSRFSPDLQAFRVEVGNLVARKVTQE